MRTCCLLLLLAGCVSEVGFAQESPLPIEAQGNLTFAEAEVRTIDVGQQHSWSVSIAKGQYVELGVQEHGLNVTILVIDPTGTDSTLFDTSLGSSQREPARWISKQAGVWEVQIRASDKARAGTYSMLWEIQREPASSDQDRIDTDQLFKKAQANIQAQQFEEAEALLQEVLSNRETGDESKIGELAPVLDALATVYVEQDRLVEAETTYERILNLQKEEWGADHPDVALSLNMLGSLAYFMGRQAEAESYIQEALAVWENALGPDHIESTAGMLNLGELYISQGKYDEAEALLTEALSIREGVLGSDHIELSNPLLSLASIAQFRGLYDRAETLAEQAIALSENQLGPDHLDVTAGLNHLAATYFYQGRADEAAPIFERVLTIREKAYGSSHSSLVSVLNNLAMAYVEMGRYDEAKPLYERALAIWEALEEHVNESYAITLKNLGQLYDWQSNLTEATLFYEQSLSILEKLYGSEYPELATVLSDLGQLYTRQERFDEAEALLLRALSLREDESESVHPEVATILDNLAVLHEVQGRYSSVEAHYLRALEIRKETLGPNHPNVAVSLNLVGLLYMELGRYDEAEAMLRRALAVRQDNYGREHPWTSISLQNLATFYWNRGRYAEAEPMYHKALQIQQNALGADHPYTATILDNLGSLYGEQHRFDEGISRLQRALEIREAGLGHKHTDVAYSLNNLAVFHMRQDRFDKAEPLQRKAIAILESNYGRVHPNIAKGLNNLAEIYIQQGDFAEAEKSYKEAFEIFQKTIGITGPEASHSLIGLGKIPLKAKYVNLDPALTAINQAIAILDASQGYPHWRVEAYAVRSRLHMQKGDIHTALSDLEEALLTAEDLRPEVGGDGENRASFFSTYTRHYDRMVAGLIENGDIEAAFEYAERGRARVLLDQLSSGKIDLRASIPADIRAELETREAQARTQLAEFQQRVTLVRARTDLPTEERMEQIAILEDSLRTADRLYRQVYQDIKTATPLWRDLLTSGGQPVALSTVQRQLVPSKGLLLLYQVGEEKSHLFVIRPGGQSISVYSLVISDDAADLLDIKPGPVTTELLRSDSEDEEGTTTHSPWEDLASRGTKVRARGSVHVEDWLHAMWKILIPEDLWPLLTEAEEVVIIPDQNLHYLPYEALIVEPSTQTKSPRYWLDLGPVIRYAPSVTALYNISQRRGSRLSPEPGLQSVLSLSDPIYDPGEVSLALAAREQTLEDSLTLAVATPLTRDSYERLGGSLARLPGTAQETEAIRLAYGEDAQQSVLVLQGLEADEPNFRAMFEGKRYLHLATHGLVDEQRGALFASLALTPPPGQSFDLDDDGFLQLHEIYDLKLPDLELAVLSACESNIGPNVDGEGIFALSRGFFAAGARRVIASQWSVDDASTAMMIGAFFNYIVAAERAGTPIDYARALRDSKRVIRNQEKWSDPYYWAPFILAGKQ